MSLNTKIKIQIPKSGVVIRKNGKYKYAYKAVDFFRNKKGQPDNKRRCIGKIDVETGLLIPNEIYFELYSENTVSVVTIDNFDCNKSIGSAFLTEKILENTGVAETIKSVFLDDKGEILLNIAKYMASEGNVMEHIGNWFSEKTVAITPFSSQYVFSFFATITAKERMEFFKKWISKHSGSDYLAYDVTSFSTYAKEISDAEFGYNRDGEDIPQVNFGCYFAQNLGLPMFYTTYPGSIVDKSHLQ